MNFLNTVLTNLHDGNRDIDKGESESKNIQEKNIQEDVLNMCSHVKIRIDEV